MIQTTKIWIRAGMRRIAAILNSVSGGRVSPNMVTWIGFAMHVPIAGLIATNHLLWAAVLLIIFGLFDTLDGELARLQKRASPAGMLLDAATDRMKEVLVYAGIAYYLVEQNESSLLVAAAVLALGASVCVSYVKAKGEAAVASGTKEIDHHTLNRMFADGLLTFEIRMTLLIIGLVTGWLTWIVVIIAAGATVTAFQRLQSISKAL